jgi:hypothetical protein
MTKASSPRIDRPDHPIIRDRRVVVSDLLSERRQAALSPA